MNSALHECCLPTIILDLPSSFTDYCASKFAAVGFAESIAMEMLAMGKTGVKSTIVCPFFINTGMFDGCRSK